LHGLAISLKGSEDLLAERRRRHRPSAFGSFEQGSADVALQAVDLGNKGRLRDAEVLGGVAQRLVADGGGETVQPLPGVRAGQRPGDRGRKVARLVCDALG
jgi:hypothetical protein